MAYEMVMPYHLHMPSYFLETFTEYPQIGKHNKEKAAIFGYAAFLIYVSMINHKSEIPQYRFSIEAPEK